MIKPHRHIVISVNVFHPRKRIFSRNCDMLCPVHLNRGDVPDAESMETV